MAVNQRPVNGFVIGKGTFAHLMSELLPTCPRIAFENLSGFYSGHAVLGVGSRKLRSQILEAHLRALWPNVILGSVLGTVRGHGTVVMPGALIMPTSVVNGWCLINTGAQIDHHSIIGQQTVIGPGVIICGNVRIGRNVRIGAGAIILPGTEVTDNVTIGAGDRVSGVVGKSVEVDLRKEYDRSVEAIRGKTDRPFDPSTARFGAPGVGGGSDI